ncbi:unnamed protein product [Urochloa humidicola]
MIDSTRQSKQGTGTLVDEEPDSPTSPGSCISPHGYTPLKRTFSFGEYGPPPRSVNRELCYNAKSSCTTSPGMDESFRPIQDGDLEYDMCPPDYSVEPWFAVRQATEFAEIALQCHNNDPNNEVKYDLVKAIASNYMFEGRGNYGHVNFTARAKQDDSEEQMFFAELNLQGSTTLTCFGSLKGNEDQVGGRLEMEMVAKGVDLEHCYTCGNELKHPSDGASYQAGHRTGRRR